MFLYQEGFYFILDGVVSDDVTMYTVINSEYLSEISLYQLYQCSYVILLHSFHIFDSYVMFKPPKNTSQIHSFIFKKESVIP